MRFPQGVANPWATLVGGTHFRKKKLKKGAGGTVARGERKFNFFLESSKVISESGY